jgi:tripeptidyl-peptidase-2
VFHGISVDQKVIALDGSESPMRIVARSLLASERLVPVATLNKVGQESILGITNYSFLPDIYFCVLQIRIPYRPVECNFCPLPTSRDRLPSGKQIIALTLT